LVRLLIEDEVIRALGYGSGDEHALFSPPAAVLKRRRVRWADPGDGLPHDRVVLVVVPVEGPL
jgi:hypothetical protein